MNAAILKFAVFSCLLWQSPVARGQAITLQKLLEQQTEWPTYAVDGRKFEFAGRFEGRSANTLRISRFEISCKLPSNGTFPDGIKSGQRIELIGRFLSENKKLSFVVSRILIKETDLDRLRSRINDILVDQPEKRLDVVMEYQSDADFYLDSALQAEITAVRTDSLSRLRVLARSDVTKLRALLQQSGPLGVKPELIQTLQFESIYAASKDPKADVDALVLEMKSSCDGWDRLVPPIPERLKLEFARDAVAAFLAAPEVDRRGLHRMLYKSLRLRQMQMLVKLDGSNGLEIAKLVRTEFGIDDPLAAEFEERDVQYRLAQLATLSRADLQGLTELLSKLNRAQQVPHAARDWLLAQERKFGTTSLAGLIRTADEYLFVADLLQTTTYHQQGVELLKQAWTSAGESSPTDADQLADRLKRLGWERLNNQWMTNAQMNTLPKDDVQLGIREGRVVRGMSMPQVVQTLGQPTKISRIASRKAVCELWSYAAEGSAGMVIRFRRSLVDQTTSSLVEDVSRIPTQRSP